MVLPSGSRPVLSKPQDHPWTGRTGSLPLPQVETGGRRTVQHKNSRFLSHPLHRVVMGSHSPLLCGLLLDTTEEATLILPDFTVDQVEELLQVQISLAAMVVPTVYPVPVREAACGGEARGDLQLPGGQEGAAGGGGGRHRSGWGGGGRGKP